MGFVDGLRSYPVTNCCSLTSLLALLAPNRYDIDETISAGYSAIHTTPWCISITLRVDNMETTLTTNNINMFVSYLLLFG